MMSSEASAISCRPSSAADGANRRPAAADFAPLQLNCRAPFRRQVAGHRFAPPPGPAAIFHAHVQPRRRWLRLPPQMLQQLLQRGAVLRMHLLQRGIAAGEDERLRHAIDTNLRRR
jgi:hypothetical protein